MKKFGIFIFAAVFACNVFAENNGASANDVQQSILNTLLIQQLMNNQQNGQQDNNQNQRQVEKSGQEKRRIENEGDLLDSKFKRFKIDDDAEDNIVFKKTSGEQYEIEIWAVDKRNNLKYAGSIVVNGKKGYKGNLLDKDLDEYTALWMKVIDNDKAKIIYLGERSDDMHFEIQ